MDKTGIIVIATCGVLLFWWAVEKKKAVEQQERAARAAQLQAQLANTNSVTTNNVVTTGTVTATQPGAPAPMIFAADEPEHTIVLTNAKARYTFTSRGGGLKVVELLSYPETISARWRGHVHNSGDVSILNNHAPLPVMAVVGDPILTGDGNFVITATGNGVHAEKVFPNGLVLSKDFELSSNYLVNANVTWRNPTDHAVTLPAQQLVVGTATPMDVDDVNALWGAIWYDGVNYFANPSMYFNTNTTAFFGMWHRTPTLEYDAGNSNVVWAAVHNQYFALLAMPHEPAWKVIEIPVALPKFQDTNDAVNIAAPQGIQSTLVFPAMTLTASSAYARPITIFAGPKEFRTLLQISEQYKNHADLVMNFGSGYASFWGIGTFFAKLLLAAMNAMHDVTRIGYGWLIVIITILIRVAFWPLTAVSLRSSKKMQALAPEIAALKEKYKDDSAKFAEKQMELWKKNGVSPMSGCLPMLVQMPVFMGFFTMIRSAIELRGASFLWAADLSKPDTLFMIPGLTFLPFSTADGFPLNPLPLLMVGAMVWQAHLQPASPGMDPGQQRMMRFIPLMFLLFFYNYSSGMALYMMVSTLAGIVQTKLTKINAAKPATPALTPAAKSKK